MVEKNDLAEPPAPDDTLGDLPPEGTQRWVARRKAQVVAAVREGRLGFEDACRRYNISHEEYASWERAIDRHGVRALRVTRLQEFR
jgi:hypothetical protein